MSHTPSVDDSGDMLPGILRRGMPPPGTPAAGTSRSPSVASAVRAGKIVARRSRDLIHYGEAGPTFSSSCHPGSGGRRGTRKGEREPDRTQSMPGVRAPRGRRPRREDEPACMPAEGPEGAALHPPPGQSSATGIARGSTTSVALKDSVAPIRSRIGTTPGRRCKPTGSENPTERSPCRGFELRGSADGRRKSGR